jgi:hypothetical protein
MFLKHTVRIGFGLAWLAGAAGAMAQTTADKDVSTEVQVDRAHIQAQRQEIVAANMTLTEKEATAFWPVYREYRGELAVTGDRMMQLIMDYAKSYDKMTDAQAQSLLDELFEIQTKDLDIHKKYAKKMKETLPGSKLARFFQVENKLDLIVKTEISAALPLVPAPKP